MFVNILEDTKTQNYLVSTLKTSVNDQGVRRFCVDLCVFTVLNLMVYVDTRLTSEAPPSL